MWYRCNFRSKFSKLWVCLLNYLLWSMLVNVILLELFFESVEVLINNSWRVISLLNTLVQGICNWSLVHSLSFDVIISLVHVTKWFLYPVVGLRSWRYKFLHHSKRSFVFKSILVNMVLWNCQQFLFKLFLFKREIKILSRLLLLIVR